MGTPVRFDGSRYVTIPFAGSEKEAEVQWIEELGESFFLMSVRLEPEYSQDPHGDTYHLWVFHLDREGLTPLYDATKWEDEDYINKGRRLLNEKGI